MIEFVHELNLLEHVVTVGPVLVQLENHDFVTDLVSDLQKYEKNVRRRLIN